MFSPLDEAVLIDPAARDSPVGIRRSLVTAAASVLGSTDSVLSELSVTLGTRR